MALLAALPAVDPTTPAELFSGAVTDGGTQLKSVLVVAVPAIVGIGAFFWAGRTVLRKLGMGGKVAKI